MPLEEILPRLTDALKRIRRHDLALRMGLELGVIGNSTTYYYYYYKVKVSSHSWTVI